nr:MAG TPA: hypothetical protein [Crassvirales sp.]
MIIGLSPSFTGDITITIINRITTINNIHDVLFIILNLFLL